MQQNKFWTWKHAHCTLHYWWVKSKEEGSERENPLGCPNTTDNDEDYFHITVLRKC